MSQRRYSTRLEQEEAVVVADLEFWDRLSEYLMDRAEDEEPVYRMKDSWLMESAKHIDEWVQRTRFKNKDER